MHPYSRVQMYEARRIAKIVSWVCLLVAPQALFWHFFFFFLACVCRVLYVDEDVCFRLIHHLVNKHTLLFNGNFYIKSYCMFLRFLRSLQSWRGSHPLICLYFKQVTMSEVLNWHQCQTKHVIKHSENLGKYDVDLI